MQRPTEGDSTRATHQFALLTQARFGPFFWTQFCGAANDNLFKFALTVMVTYQLQVAWLPASLAGLVIGALFILPFVLFSATSGQLAEKYDHARLMRGVKNFEIVIMGIAAIGFATHHVTVLLLCTFLMGLHSTLFGPVKFAYLPRILQSHELTGGNGMVEMGTFVAILLGNVAGGLLVAMPEIGHTVVALACLLLALIGRWVSARIPSLPASLPDVAINWNPFTEAKRNLQLARTNPQVFHTLLGISWMWFFGAMFLSQFPSFAKAVLHGDAHVASLLLVLFSVGIGIGALMCETLSRGRVEIGLVPLGAMGMSLFAVDLHVASSQLAEAPLMNIATFLSDSTHWRVMADLLLLSLSTGLYSVPMYAWVQLHSPATECGRIMAANNIINALFMIASALIAGALLSTGLTISEVLMWTGVANAAVTTALFVAEPIYLRRLADWLRGV
jgi:MFS family permease